MQHFTQLGDDDHAPECQLVRESGRNKSPWPSDWEERAEQQKSG